MESIGRKLQTKESIVVTQMLEAAAGAAKLLAKMKAALHRLFSPVEHKPAISFNVGDNNRGNIYINTVFNVAHRAGREYITGTPFTKR